MFFFRNKYFACLTISDNKKCILFTLKCASLTTSESGLNNPILIKSQCILGIFYIQLSSDILSKLDLITKTHFNARCKHACSTQNSDTTYIADCI